MKSFGIIFAIRAASHFPITLLAYEAILYIPKKALLSTFSSHWILVQRLKSVCDKYLCYEQKNIVEKFYLGPSMSSKIFLRSSGNAFISTQKSEAYTTARQHTEILS